MKKNIFDKFQNSLAANIEKFEKREDKDVLKKIPFWLIFFFPYAIYLLLFKTKIKKWIKVAITTLIILISLISLDVTLRPNSVYNSVSKEAYTSFVSENPNLKLREPLYSIKTSHFKIDDELYFGFNVYDSLDMYYAIFKVKDYTKNYELVSLYSIDYDFSNVYSSKEFEKFKEIHPVILSFLCYCEKDLDVQSISKETDVKEEDIFYNRVTQDLKIKDTVYSFELNDFLVTKVIDKNSKEVLFDNTSKSAYDLYLPQILKNALKKNFGNSYEIVGYNYWNNAHYYNLDVADKNYTLKYLPGQNWDLLLIDDLELFKKDFTNLVRK